MHTVYMQKEIFIFENNILTSNTFLRMCSLLLKERTFVVLFTPTPFDELKLTQESYFCRHFSCGQKHQVFPWHDLY